MFHLAELAAQPAPPTWGTLLFGPLHFLIYVVLGPLVYFTILLFGIEMAIPGGTPLRALVRRHGAVSPVKIALANDPTTRLLSVVAGLLALAFWSAVVTAWLAGYLQGLRAPQLTASQATFTSTLIFLTTFVVGLILGDLWANGVRLAQTARASLAVLVPSMALSGTMLFFYIVEPSVEDVLLVAALGIFIGELSVAARHPTIFHEGLFDVVRSPLQSDEAELAEDGEESADADSDNRIASTGGWLTTQTRAMRERLAAQRLLGVGVTHSEPPLKRSPSGELEQQREGNPTRPV